MIEPIQCFATFFLKSINGDFIAALSSLDLIDDKDQEVSKNATFLLRSGIKRIKSRLDYFEEMYGTGEVYDHFDVQKVKDLCDKIFLESGTSISFQYDTDFTSDNTLLSSAGKLILALIYMGYSAILYEGTINVNCSHDNNKYQISIECLCKVVIDSNEQKHEIISGTADPGINHSNFDAYYIHMLAKLLKASTKIKNNISCVEYVVSIPKSKVVGT